MNAVGIDISKGKSTVTIRRPGDIVVMPPCDIPHTQSAINCLIKQIQSLDGETKVCMEHTGRYYEPVATWLSDAGIFVSAVNPILIKGTEKLPFFLKWKFFFYIFSIFYLEKAQKSYGLLHSQLF